MRRIDFDSIVCTMLDAADGISDLVFTVGRPLQVESFGKLLPVKSEFGIQALTSFQLEKIALFLMGNNRRLMSDFLRTGSCDTSYALSDDVRFRVNIFRQRGHFAVVMRMLQMKIPTIDGLKLPAICKEVAREKNGLVLVTGATGSGKTTTLAAILGYINEHQAVHIVTLEDPIEFVHPHKLATFSQREMGLDFDDYPNGIRAALRQAPKVILVGEIRDRETAEAVLTAAETGHLVLSTLHTINAGQSINRILGMFDESEQENLRLRLSDTLRYVLSQRLAPRIGGGRLLIPEIMGSNLRTKELIEQGEREDVSFHDIIEDNFQNGWTTFDRSCVSAFEADLIDEETAILYCSRRGVVRRQIDTIKKVRSGMGEQESGLQLDTRSLNR